MNMNDLNSVEWGDTEGLQLFLFENALQHNLFKSTFSQKNIITPSYNLFDVQVENIDDWMLPHQDEHQFFAQALGLQNPINLLDMNWNNEEQFYDWVADHYFIHTAIANSLGLSNA
jgi:hypothetical protein